MLPHLTKLHLLLKTTTPKCHPILNTHHQTSPPPQNQNQNTFNPPIPHHHLNHNTNSQTYPQNYQTAQNSQSPTVDPPLPKITTFQINVHAMHGSELGHYEEQEREWREKEEAKVDIKEEIKKSMKELQCILDIAGLSYEDLCIHPNLIFQKGSKSRNLILLEECGTLWLI